MTTDEVLRVVRRRGCEVLPAKGSHRKVRCGKCATIVAIHKGDIPMGTLRSIVCALEPCLGKHWHKE